MKKLLESIWKVLDGNKTILCTFVFAWLSGDAAANSMEPEMLASLKSVVLAIGGASMGHHIVKGNLKKG